MRRRRMLPVKTCLNRAFFIFGVTILFSTSFTFAADKSTDVIVDKPIVLVAEPDGLGSSESMNNFAELVQSRYGQYGSGGKRVWRYAISGGIISLGVSYFASSMASRNLDEDKRDTVIYGGTAAGTVLGTLIFAKIGANKDRKRLQPAPTPKPQPSETDKTLMQLQQEIEAQKKAREKQDAELEALKKQVEDEKKKNPTP